MIMGPHWIKQWIADLAALNDQFRDDEGKIDFEALGREEYAFRTALITCKFSKSDRAKETYMRAKTAYDASVANGSKGGRPRKNKDTTADGDTREDSHDGKSGTSANHSATTTCTIITDVQKRTGGHSPSSQSPSSRPPVRTSRRIPRPRSFDEVVEFADHEGLDYDDVRLWWERNFVERPGCDKDGVVFDNWKGALINACKAEERKRNGENKT